MIKKRIISHVLLLTLAAIFLSAPFLCAQTPSNNITLTTYYPAPFGAYKKMTISDSVGIGTTSPTAKLQVQDGDIRIQSTASFTGPRRLIISDSVGGLGHWGEVVTGDPGALTLRAISAGEMRFALANSAGTQPFTFVNEVTDQELMRITASGNVGIGTSSPGAQLDVNSGSINLAAVFEANGSAADRRATILVMNTASVPNSSVSSRINFSGTAIPTGGSISPGWEIGTDFNRNGGNDMYFYNYDKNHVPKDLLYMNGDTGNIGIGTTSPQAKLDIGGVAGTDGIRFPDTTVQVTALPTCVDNKYLKTVSGTWQCVDSTFTGGWVAINNPSFISPVDQVKAMGLIPVISPVPAENSIFRGDCSSCTPSVIYSDGIGCLQIYFAIPCTNVCGEPCPWITGWYWKIAGSYSVTAVYAVPKP